MKPLHEFQHSQQLKFWLSDIDDTLTDEGELRPDPYRALWDLQSHGIKVIPVTGRPAGWCEMIARLWPVVGVIGENGAFYFRYDRQMKKMHRVFLFDENQRREHQKNLEKIRDEVLRTVPGCQVASDQFSRLTDLAIDFAEDVEALPREHVLKIQSIYERYGAVAKISSIHVNGWFGTYDKVSTSKLFLKNEFHLSETEILSVCAFSGDSPNDEPMFEFFPNSFAVANIKDFVSLLKCRPSFVSSKNGGAGFCEIVEHVLMGRRAEALQF